MIDEEPKKTTSNSVIPVKNTDNTIEGAECDFDKMPSVTIIKMVCKFRLLKQIYIY